MANIEYFYIVDDIHKMHIKNKSKLLLLRNEIRTKNYCTTSLDF